MNVDRQNMGSCRVKLVVDADVNETRPEYEKVIRSFMQHGQVKGFRVGKVPRDIIQRNFGSEIREETTTRLMQDLYRQAVEKEGIRVVNIIELEDVKFSPEGGISFSAVLDVEPEFDLPNYSKIVVPMDEIVITDEQVEKRIADLRRAFAKFSNATDDDVIGKDDLVSIDFRGKIGDEGVEAVCADAALLAEGKDFWCQVGDGRFLPELSEALEGMRCGESKEGIVVVFSDDIQFEELQGKDASYDLTVKTLRKLVLPEREELATQLRLEGVEKLDGQIRDSLEEEAKAELLKKQEKAIIDYLLEKAEFDLPESEVAAAISNMLDRMASEAHRQGATREELEEQREEILSEATAAAKGHVKLRYILKGIAEKEEVSCSDDDLSHKIVELAYAQQVRPDEVFDHIKKNNHLPRLKDQVLMENTIKHLLEKAKS